MTINGVTIDTFSKPMIKCGDRENYFDLTVGNCLITSVAITSGGQPLTGLASNKVYSNFLSTAFTYQLAVDTSTTCGYSATAWTVATTSDNNALSVS